jgi:hypothetical protein
MAYHTVCARVLESLPGTMPHAPQEFVLASARTAGHLTVCPSGVSIERSAEVEGSARWLVDSNPASSASHYNSSTGTARLHRSPTIRPVDVSSY